jgi:hypothetical protein
MPGGFPLGFELANAIDVGTAPASTRGTALTSGNAVYGSYATVIANTPSDAAAIIVSVESNATANTGIQVSIKISVGASGSEEDFIRDLIVYCPVFSYYSHNYFFPVGIPAGTRIAAASLSPANTDAAYVSIILLDGAFTQLEGCAGVDSIGQKGGKGTTLTSGSANTKGSYTQIIGSTLRDYIGFVLAIDGNNATITLAASTGLLIDIAIGASGSELNILTNYFVGLQTNSSLVVNGTNGSPSPFIPIPIPAGSRLSARMQSTNASQAFNITLYGVYQ